MVHLLTLMNTNNTILLPEFVLYADLTYTSVNAKKIVIAKTIGDDIGEDLYKINNESGTCRKCFFKTLKNMSNYRIYMIRFSFHLRKIVLTGTLK